jgi:hypothetical protein
MSNIDKVLDATKAVVEELKKQNIFFKVSVDKDASIVRIYGEGSQHIKRASSGLGEVMEMAYTRTGYYCIMLQESARRFWMNGSQN